MPTARCSCSRSTACIQFLPTLDGKALFTVEDLKAPDGALHPVQQAMVDCHGSQCGFCTPGFVMSLWACHRRHQDAGSVPTASSSPMTCPATCAAAPATGRSSMPASACSSCRPRPRQGHGGGCAEVAGHDQPLSYLPGAEAPSMPRAR
jgi:hypothetical protein